jgi:hypothetical protein
MVRLVSIRDLRNTPSEVWSALESDDLVLTKNGDPVAIIARIEGSDLESTLAAVRRVRAQQAVSRLRSEAQGSGAATLTDADIDAEIAAARAERRGR